MITLNRIALPSINAALITGALLYAMFLLVDLQEPQLLPPEKLTKLGWTLIPEDPPPTMLIPKPEKLPEVEKPPKLIVDDPEIDLVTVDITDVFVDYVNAQEETALFNLNDSQLVLAIGFPPTYPSSATRRAIEGYVVVGFSVSTSGFVVDPFIIESEPGTTFDRAALTAIKKFKYKPRMVEGNAVHTDGQRYMFTFEMES